MALPQRSYLNFSGLGVLASDDVANNRTVVTISGGGGGAVASVFGRAGDVVALAGDYTAAKVTNAVDSSSAYANPTWITSLGWSKITGAPAIFADPTTTKGDLIARGTAAPATRLGVGADGLALVADSSQPLGVKWATVSSGGSVSSVFGRTGVVVANAGDYTAAQVNNAADITQSYANPAWITALAWSKITGAPATRSFLGLRTNGSGRIRNRGLQRRPGDECGKYVG